MNQVFGINKKWAIARRATLLNFSIASFLLIILSLKLILDLPFGAILFFLSIDGLLVFTTGYFTYNFLNTPVSVILNKKDVEFLFPLNKRRKFALSETEYFATGSTSYMRGSYCHSIIFDIPGKRRLAVTSLMIENYSELFELIKESGIPFYGFVGRTNWKRRNMAISKKWIIKDEEEQLISSIGKEKGIVFNYLIISFILFLNLFIIAGFIFGFENIVT